VLRSGEDWIEAGLYDPVWTATLRGVKTTAIAHDVNDVASAEACVEGGAVPDATRFLQSLGRALRERREELQLTQEAVSLRTGVPQRRIWELEAGVGNPTTRTLLRLVSGLDIRCSQLIARAEQLEAQSLAAEAGG
jgi:DNA-binding XRE family transcriptional regulator